MSKFVFDLDCEPIKTDINFVEQFRKVRAVLEGGGDSFNQKDIKGFFAFFGIKTYVEIADALGITRQSVARWLSVEEPTISSRRRVELLSLLEPYESDKLLFSDVDSSVLRDLAAAADSLQKVSMGLSVKDVLKHLLAQSH